MLLAYVGSWPAVCIHGDKSQPERDHVLQGNCPFSCTETFSAQWMINYHALCFNKDEVLMCESGRKRERCPSFESLLVVEERMRSSGCF